MQARGANGAARFCPRAIPRQTAKHALRLGGRKVVANKNRAPAAPSFPRGAAVRCVLKSEIPYPRCSFASQRLGEDTHYSVARVVERAQDFFGKVCARVQGHFTTSVGGGVWHVVRRCGRHAQTGAATSRPALEVRPCN